MAPHVDLNTRPAQNPAPTEARPATWVPVAEKGLFAPKKMRVITVGAGHAGLMMAYKMRHEVKCEGYVDHVIYEKNVRIAPNSLFKCICNWTRNKKANRFIFIA